MNTKNQKEAFLKYEADNYFQRNKEVKYDGDRDIVINVLKKYSAAPKSVSKLYRPVGKRSMDRRSKSYDLSGDFYNKYVLTTLKKDLNAAYKH